MTNDFIALAKPDLLVSTLAGAVDDLRVGKQVGFLVGFIDGLREGS